MTTTTPITRATITEAVAGLPVIPTGYGRLLDAQVPLEARILTRAAELLIRDGWCQNVGEDDAGRRCLMRAVCDAVRELSPHDLSVEWDVVDLIDETVRARGFDGRSERFNDTDGRSLDDVLDLIAAARAAVTG